MGCAGRFVQSAAKQELVRGGRVCHAIWQCPRSLSLHR